MCKTVIYFLFTTLNSNSTRFFRFICILTVYCSGVRSMPLFLAIVVALFAYILVTYAVLLVTTNVSSLGLVVEHCPLSTRHVVQNSI